jgi:hypothetical protein
MRRYNIVSRIILIITVIAFALAAPVLVQEKSQAGIDVVHVPGDVITVLGKRILEEDFDVLWDGWWHYLNVLGEPPPPPIVWRNRYPAAVHLQEPAPPSNVPPPTLARVHMPEVHVPPQDPADSDRESMKLNDDAPLESLGSSTESDSDPDRWSTISNAPSAASLSENLKAADAETRGKAKVSRRISGTTSGVDMVNAAQK